MKTKFIHTLIFGVPIFVARYTERVRKSEVLKILRKNISHPLHNDPQFPCSLQC